MNLIQGSNAVVNDKISTPVEIFVENIGNFDVVISAIVSKDDKVATTDFSTNIIGNSDNSIVWVGEKVFIVDLVKLDKTTKVNFTISVSTSGVTASVKNVGKVSISIGSDVQYEHVNSENESAIILAQLYYHSGKWKVKAVGQGFINGISKLHEYYGIVPTDCVKPQKVKRRSRAMILDDQVADLMPKVKEFMSGVTNPTANYKRLLYDFLNAVLGYDYPEIKTTDVHNRFTITMAEVALFSIDVKKVNKPLRKDHALKAVTGGVENGVNWVVLTNLVEWKIYHIHQLDAVVADLVMNVNLRSTNLVHEVKNIALLSKLFMRYTNNDLERIWRAKHLGNSSTAGDLLLTNDMISKLRKINTPSKVVSPSILIDNTTIHETVQTIS